MTEDITLGTKQGLSRYCVQVETPLQTTHFSLNIWPDPAVWASIQLVQVRSPEI